MRVIFDSITRLSLRFKWITVAITILLIGLGVFSYTQLNQELIPSIEFPQTFIFSQNGGASSDNMLHMYSIPLEDAGNDVDGVVNIETTSDKGLSFVILRNEFGLVQSSVVDDIREKVDSIPLPIRHLDPPSGMTAVDLIGQLDGNHIAWLYAYAESEEIGFAEQLDRDVWNSFSADALAGFPETVFANLETDLRDSLLEKRSDALTIASIDDPAPELPSGWSANDGRFKTVEDIAEMASNRSLAAVFNDFYEEDYLVGPLVYTDDLNAEAIEIFLDVENRCRAYRQENNLVDNGDVDDPCSFIAYLDAEVILAIEALADIPDGWLPDNYLSLLSNRDRNTLAQVRLIQILTGETIERPAVELPDAWRVEAPSLLTFSFSDLPVGLITISSDVLSDAELEQYVADVLVPTLKDIDDVAEVSVVGGESVPSFMLNPELEAVGLPPVAADDSELDETTSDTSDTDETPDNVEETSDAPAIGGNASTWQQAADGFGVEEFNTADDFFVTVSDPDGNELYGIEIINWMATYQFTTDLIAQSITADVLLWMGEEDATTWENISPDTLRILPIDVVSQLPEEAQSKLVCTLELNLPEGVTIPALSSEWQTILSTFRVEQLNNTSGMLGLNWQPFSGVIGGSAADLALIAKNACQTPSAFLNQFGAIPASQGLFNTLSADSLDYLAQVETDFYVNLGDTVINALSWQTVNQLSADVQARYNIPLGSSWQQLSALPEATQTEFSIQTVNDLIDEGDVAEQLSMMMDILHNQQYNPVGNFCGLANRGFCGFAILLMNDLSPDVFEALIANDNEFLEELISTQGGATGFTYISREAMNSSSVNTFIEALPDGDLKSVLVDIRDGNRPTAAEVLQSEQVEIVDDENAPELPQSWGAIGGFIGAKLEQADDIINTQYLPDYESGADFINSLATDPRGQGQGLVGDLTADIWLYLGENEPNFWVNLNASALRLIAEDVVPALPQEVQERITAGGEAFEPSDYVTRTDGSTSLVINVFKTNDANTVTTWHDIQEVLDDVPDNVKVFVPFEQASFIEESIEGVTREGTTGAVMAIIVILIFMNLSIRSTLVTSVSIPASVMTALFLMKFVPTNVYDILSPVLEDVGRDSTLGSILEVIVRLFPETYTLNIMTLSGLTVAIGRVVDDSIVVLENIYRNIQQGADQTEAILRGTREVSVAIFAATLTTMVVFLPLGLFGGVIGSFFLPFGLAVTYALAASYLVAITTIPVLAKFFITKESIPAEGQIPITSSMGGFEKALSQAKNIFISAIDRLSEIYGVAIRWVLNHRVITLAVAFASLFFGMWLFGQRPQTFLPSFGEPTIVISVNLPAETDDGQPITLAYTEAHVLQIEDFLSKQDSVNTVLTSVGGSLGSVDDPTAGINVIETQAEIQVGMPSQEALDEFLPDLRVEAERIFGDENVQVSGSAGDGFGGFALELSGDESVSLNDLAYYNNEVLAALSGVEGLVNVESTIAQTDGVPAIYFSADGGNDIDTDTLLSDLNAAIIATDDNTSELIFSIIDDAETDFTLMLTGNESITFDEITTYAETVLGILSENSALTNVESTLGLAGVSGDDVSYIRIDGIPAVRYTGELESADTLGVTELAIDRVDDAVKGFREKYGAQLNLTSELTVGQGFESEQQSDGVQQMFVSMGIATLIVYFLLALTFGHAIHPITILVSLPLSIVGAAIALTIADRAVGLSALIGMLMLIGIVVTNAVVLLDRVQQNRRENNMSTYDALVEAGTVRLRPILMTAISTTCGVLPLALGFAEGAIIAAELGTVVIGGLVSSTFLTLLVVPVVYSLFDTAIQWVLGLFGGGAAASPSAN